MKVLVTGANGFIGKNLVARLKELKVYEVISIDKENTREELVNGILESEFIFHLAGINRPKDEKEFFEGNSGLTGDIVNILKVAIHSTFQSTAADPHSARRVVFE